LKGVLDLDFLYPLTKHYYGESGQKSIDPVVFFKLCLVGYLHIVALSFRSIASVTITAHYVNIALEGLREVVKVVLNPKDYIVVRIYSFAILA